MKTAATCAQEVVVTSRPEPDSGRHHRRVRRVLGGPGRYWLRLGERLFHYQLLRAQMLERAFLPDDRSGESR